MDVERGELLVENLSMPHSPRWHAGRRVGVRVRGGDSGVARRAHRKV